MSERLPTVSPETAASAASSATPSSSDGTSPTAPVARPRASSIRLVTTLALAGAVAGFFIVLVHTWSEPRIEAHRAAVLAQAVQEVLASPATTSVFYLEDGQFTATPDAAADTAGMDRVWVGWDAAGMPIGIAAQAGEPGFQDIISLIFGFVPGESTVLGMKVLESRETPGLGDKIEKDSSFVAAFAGALTPLLGVKAGKATGGNNEIDMITGATISSKAVIDIINHRLEALGAPLASLWAGGVPSPAPPVSAPMSGEAEAGGNR